MRFDKRKGIDIPLNSHLSIQAKLDAIESISPLVGKYPNFQTTTTAKMAQRRKRKKRKKKERKRSKKKERRKKRKRKKKTSIIKKNKT
ncbi:MAG: hypothetical protein QXP60_02385 [Nitrososphaerota archaeon]